MIYCDRLGQRVLWPGFLAVVRFGSSPTPSPPLPSVSSTGGTQKDWERDTSCWRERVRRGWARNRIIRPQESLVLYKSFNTLWLCTSCCVIPLIQYKIAVGVVLWNDKSSELKSRKKEKTPHYFYNPGYMYSYCILNIHNSVNIRDSRGIMVNICIFAFCTMYLWDF